MKKIFLMLSATTVMFSCSKEKSCCADETTENNAPAIEAAAPETKVNQLSIEGTDQMKYNKTTLKAQAGEPITLTLKHTGEQSKETMGHNFVLLKKGTDVDAFGQAATQAQATDYIPQDMKDDVIAHTRILGGGEEDTIEIPALDKGEYDFICSFPGHYVMMHGKLIVE
ncbi:azurin [Ornithobacterium rhinotracheale]|uniref:azurin n=1 Tax=Ornithobacterium rhinotracheale TaxID=28251 RepID=UPI00129C566B|nr:azurin [Ornithobacterium rhinotracheale]MRJ10054.1 azurin [Ornithobacterium rhinotracheale]